MASTSSRMAGAPGSIVVTPTVLVVTPAVLVVIVPSAARCGRRSCTRRRIGGRRRTELGGLGGGLGAIERDPARHDRALLRAEPAARRHRAARHFSADQSAAWFGTGKGLEARQAAR